MVSVWVGDRGGHSYFGSCSCWITSLEPHHGEVTIECSSFSSQTRNADRQAHLEQPDRDLTDATQQRTAKPKYQVGTSGRWLTRWLWLCRWAGEEPEFGDRVVADDCQFGEHGSLFESACQEAPF